MLLMVICGALVLLGLAAVIRWGGLSVQPPPSSHEEEAAPGTGSLLRRYLWWITVATEAGLLTGLSMSGAGGRLAMRLLAVTAGPEAQGLKTEAEEVVGEITLEGTLGLFVFVGLLFGLATAGLYLLIRRWMPSGWAGGLLFGIGMLVVLGTRADPLRADNPDFGVVGPGWLAIVVFSVLVIAHGILLTALFARISRALPLISRRPRVLAAYSPVLLMLPAVTPALVLAIGAVIAVALGQMPAAARAMRSRPVALAGRVILGALLLVSAPSFVMALADIART